MKSRLASRSNFIKIVRIIARSISLLMIALSIFFIIGEALTEHGHTPSLTPLPNIVAGLLMLGGLAIAWWRELFGGIISIIGFACVMTLNARNASLPMMYLFLLPAVLFLVIAINNRIAAKGHKDL